MSSPVPYLNPVQLRRDLGIRDLSDPAEGSHAVQILIDQAVEALGRALAEGSGGREDIVAEELRLAGRELGRLTGRVDVEDVLDVIFREFCIGK